MPFQSNRLSARRCRVVILSWWCLALSGLAPGESVAASVAAQTATVREVSVPHGPTAGKGAEDIFAAAKGAVVQVRIVDAGTGAQTVIGSGFHVGGGRFLTNYHVMQPLLERDTRARALARTFDQQEFVLEPVSVDIVHDLALLQAHRDDLPALRLAEGLPARGQRIYSLGIPLDIGFTLVEGNYNGSVKADPRRNFHFSGALNSGVSGGPAITADGAVIGVNVASRGESVSYLVPVRYAAELLSNATERPVGGVDDAIWRLALKSLVRSQLLAEQERLADEFVARELPQVTLGQFRVPDVNVDWVSCWGQSEQQSRQLLKTSRRACRTESRIFVESGLTAGTLSYSADWLDGDALAWLPFLKQYGNAWSALRSQGSRGTMINPPVCQHDVFESRIGPLRGMVCLRPYADYPGLHEVEFRAARVPGGERKGLVIGLSASGFTVATAGRMIRHYLASLSPAIAQAPENTP